MKCIHLVAALGLLSLSLSATANCPAGWTNVTSGKSVRLCKKDNMYVQRVDLSSGARVRLAYQFQGGAGAFNNPNPTFVGRDVLEWWQFATANNGNNVQVKPAGAIYSVVSGSFFCGNFGGDPIQQSSYPIKNRGGLLTVGCDTGTATPLRELRMNDSDASIVYYDSNPKDWNTVHSKVGPFTSVVGMHPGSVDSGLDALFAKGRTYVGLRDNNNDGKFEWIMFLSTNGSKKAEVYKALNTDFGATVNIQFDGSGTSQMVSRGTEYVKSSDGNNRRNFPMAFVIYEAQ